MLIEVYAEEDSYVGAIALEAHPQIGAILKFTYEDWEIVDRYKVVAVEYVFETKHVGEAVKTSETSLVGVRCSVEQISADRGG